VGGILLVVFSVGFCVQKSRTGAQEAHHTLSERELQQQQRLLDGKTKLVRSGFWDNFLFYLRNNAPLLAMLMPMKISPIDAEEAILLLGTTMGFAYMMVGVQSNIKTEDAFTRWALITALSTIPALLMQMILKWASTGEEKAYQKMRAEGKDLDQDPGVIAFRHDNPEYKFLTRSDQFFNKESDGVSKFENMLYLMLALMMAFWCIGIAMVKGPLTSFLIGYGQTWVRWFVVAPVQFWCKYRSEPPAPSAYANLTPQEAGMEQGGANADADVKPENEEKPEAPPVESIPPEEKPEEGEEKPEREDPYKELRDAYEPEKCEGTVAGEEILTNYIGEQCCMSRGPIGNMDIKEFSHLFAMNYRFESFCEYRCKHCREEPYSPGSYSMKGSGEEPELWDMNQMWDVEFVEARKEKEVPYTSEIVTCPRCHGSGHITVTKDGKQERETCPRCRGAGKLRNFKVLVSIYGSKLLQFVMNKTHLPDCFIKEAKGTAVGDPDYGEKIEPLGDQFPQFFQKVSADLHAKFHSVVGLENDNRIRMHKQRQSLEQIAVHEFTWTLDQQTERFFVYGVNDTVYCPYYPASCIYCCNSCDVRFHVCACCQKGCTIL